MYKSSASVKLSECNKKDRLFVLELFRNQKHKCENLHCPHNGHSTDDTGYGTDNEDTAGGSENNPDYKPLDIVGERCSQSTVDFTRMDSIRRVRLKVKKVNLQSLNISDKDRKLGQLGRALCKELIGIIPGESFLDTFRPSPDPPVVSGCVSEDWCLIVTQPNIPKYK